MEEEEKHTFQMKSIRKVGGTLDQWKFSMAETSGEAARTTVKKYNAGVEELA